MRVPLAVACGVLLVLGACIQAGPRTSPAPATERAEASGRDVSFTTADGPTLAGRLFEAGSVGVILAHMRPADARSWYPMARRLAAAGYTALAFNFRGYAGSEGSRDPERVIDDLRGAWDFMVARGASRVAMVGASMGATGALVLGASVQAAAVVAVSAPVQFGPFDAAKHAANIRAPVLLMASRDDRDAYTSLQALTDALAQAPTTTRLFEGDAHGTTLFEEKPQAADEVIRFLTEHVPPA